MHSIIYNKLIKAKENKDLSMMKLLYDNNSRDLLIGIEYAKLLIEEGKKQEGKDILLDMLYTNNESYAMFELGKLEMEDKNFTLARTYFEKLLKFGENKLYAKFELGKLEKYVGNTTAARKNFKELLNTEIKNDAMYELGKLERDEGNINLARKYFQPLLNITKDRPYTLLELGKLENKLGNLDLAEGYFKEALNAGFRSYAIKMLILLEISRENYIDAFYYLNIALKENIDVNLDIIVFISKKLNVFFDIDYSKIKYSYTMGQICDYDEQVGMAHIYDRHVHKIDSTSDFNSNVDVEFLFNDIKNSLTKNNKVSKLVFNDLYVIKRHNVGKNGENYLLVVTLPNSKDIITMYPIIDRRHISRYSEQEDKEFAKSLVKVK